MASTAGKPERIYTGFAHCLYCNACHDVLSKYLCGNTLCMCVDKFLVCAMMIMLLLLIACVIIMMTFILSYLFCWVDGWDISSSCKWW